MSGLTSAGMFSGAGGLDLGFERAGFEHVAAMDYEAWCVRTLEHNRPTWRIDHADAREWDLTDQVDVLVAGPPCQGYSLGGKRDPEDDRNLLYREVVRVARETRPRVVVIENVLNLRTMVHPETGRLFPEQIVRELTQIGYDVHHGVIRMDGHDVPQTRRRFVFVAFRDGAPEGYRLPQPGGGSTIRPWLHELGQTTRHDLPNHRPEWGFRSRVHDATGEEFDPSEEAVVVRFSRTASDGNPVRSFDRPFPAVDTATVWGWAQGHVTARRVERTRRPGDKFVRNAESTVPLWRISASRLRAMTPRELARLQTFPDDWVFEGTTQRDVQLQIGNAVPVNFATSLATNVAAALDVRRDEEDFRAIA